MRRTHFAAVLGLGSLIVPANAGEAPLIGVEEDTGDFYAISTADASLQLIGHSGITGLGALEFNPSDGFFYGFTTGDNSVLYRFYVSPALDSVAGMPVGSLGLGFVYEGALAFAPDGTAYAMNGGTLVPSLLTLDLGTGEATIVASMQNRHDIAGLGWRSDGVLIGLDSTDNDLLVINPANAAVSLIDDVTPTIGGVGGMALFADTGYFVTAGLLAGVPPGVSPGSNALYSFDPLTGEHFFIGSFDNVILGSGFSGLAIVPEPGSLALLVIAGIPLLVHRREP
jgi:hypothetical protein